MAPVKETHFDAVDKTVRRLETIRRRVERGLWTLSALRFLSFAAAAGGALGSAALGYAFRFSLLAALPGLGLFVFFFFLYYKRRDAGSEVRNLIHHRQGDLLRDQPGWWKDNSTPAWPAPENHPYASDLHMTGQFSIGRLLDRTTVPGARAVLYDLLLNQPDKAALDPDEWRKRRDAVHELSRRKVWQSRMRRAGSAERSSRIFEESEDTPVPHVPKPPVLLVVLAWTLPVITIATWIGIQYDALPAWYLLTYPAQLALFAYGMFRYKAAGALYYARADIYADYARVFRAAAFPFQSAALLDDLFQKDQAHLAAGRLAWVATLFAVRRNPILYFLAGSVFLLEIHAAWAAARWEERYAMDFPKWVQEVRRLDAWMSLAIFERNHRDWTAPAQASRDALVVFSTEDAAHPLLPPASRVGNSITFADDRLWLVAGSNMSGKSTLLRTTGVNLILAMAGSVVCARNYAFRPVRVITSLNVADDLAQSVSLFYAEVRRIKMVLEAARSSEPPLFFLLDEILRGTNAGERHTAVRSIVLDLLDAGARGILSTHDTALLDISREETGVGLYHFQEAVQDGKMVFDYKMMPGPPSGSNALAVLRGEGIRIR